MKNYRFNYIVFAFVATLFLGVRSSIEVYFSPDDNIAAQFVSHIKQEQKSIDIAIYTLTNREITRALIGAYERGVKVAVLIDEFSLATRTKYDAVQELMKAHVPVYLFNPKEYYEGGSGQAQLFHHTYPALSNYSHYGEQPKLPGGKQQLGVRPLLHHKFCLFKKNGEAGPLVFTGSFNFTHSANAYNQENVLVVSGNETYRAFKKQFGVMKRNRATRLSRYEQTDFGKGVREVLFTPDERAAERVVELIDDEHQQIDMAIYGLSHKDIIDALMRAQERGVVISIIVDHGSQARLVECGMQVHTFDPGKYRAGSNVQASRSAEDNETTVRSYKNTIMHNKFCVFHQNRNNHKLLLTGSMNFTYGSTCIHQNNVLIVDDVDVIAKYENQFNLMRDYRTTLVGANRNFLEDVTHKVRSAFRKFIG